MTTYGCLYFDHSVDIVVLIPMKFEILELASVTVITKYDYINNLAICDIYIV